MIAIISISDFERINQVSSFVDVIVDAFSENENKASVAKRFTLYSALTVTMRRILTNPCWTGKVLSSLAIKIRKFNATETELFGKYRAIGMGTQTRHIFGYLASTLNDVGGLEFLRTGCFEGAHCNFKQFC